MLEMIIPKTVQESVFGKASALGLISSKQVIFKDITDTDELKNEDDGEVKNRFLNCFGYSRDGNLFFYDKEIFVNHLTSFSCLHFSVKS